MKNKSVILMILDGWGLSPLWGGNALAMSSPKNMDSLWRHYPHTVLQALSAISTDDVVGDSRLGHTLIGAGRPVESNYSLINKEIKSRRFFKNSALVGAIDWAKKNNSNLHLIGLISDGGIHSHIDHLFTLLRLAREKDFNRIYIDAITDGVDSGPTDALDYIEKLQNKMRDLKIGEFSSIAGRNWAMDRDKRWDKIETYYNTIIKFEKKTKTYTSIETAIKENYQAGNNDDFVLPGLIADKEGKTHPIKKNDALIFFNFREDRTRELVQVFVDNKFRDFLWRPQRIEDLYVATFVNYQRDLPAKVAYDSKNLPETLSEVLSKINFKQLKIAESQKYAHVTYFFNGGNEDTFIGEERIIIPSPNVKSFAETPAMSAKTVAKEAIKAIKRNNYDLIVVNFANIDILAHTGNIAATGQAIQVVDKLVNEIAEAGLKVNSNIIITADHGNAEQMVQLKSVLSEERETQHTLNPVPFILINNTNRKDLLKSAITHQPNALSKIIQAKDTLADVAPTILEIMGVPKPKQMTGHSLLNRLE